MSVACPPRSVPDDPHHRDDHLDRPGHQWSRLHQRSGTGNRRTTHARGKADADWAEPVGHWGHLARLPDPGSDGGPDGPGICPIGTAPSSIIADTDACADVRSALGDGYCLMLDSAWAYSYKEALDVGFAIQDLGYHWYEDPIGAEDIQGYVRLKQHLSIPIDAAEVTQGGLRGLPAWVVTPPMPSGRRRHQRRDHRDDEDRGAGRGLSPALRNPRCLQRDRQPRHRACCDGRTELFDASVLVVHEAGSYDLDHLSYGLVEPISMVGGTVHAPERPGLGIEPDWDLLRSNVIAELS